MMGTRTGDIDPGVITYVMEKEHLGIQGVSTLLNKFSGVLGISGISSDMREIEDAVNKGNEKSQIGIKHV